jgi:hypothetical protein
MEYEVYRKVPGLDKKKCWLTLLNFGYHFLHNSLLWNVYSDPIIFPHFKSTVEVILLNAVEYHLRFPLDVRDTVSKPHPFNFIFNLGNKAKSQGAKSGE